MVKLGEVAKERRESIKTDKANMPIVGLEHLIPQQVQLTEWSNDADNTFTKLFHKGDVLFGRRRAYLKKASLAPFDGICSGDITVIAPIENKIAPELLPFIIQNDTFFDYAVEKSAGSLSPRVKWEHLKNYEFELPGLEQQRKLAKILWAAEETKQAYKKLLQKTDDMIKARFIEMFGVPGEDKFGWGLHPLSNYCYLNPRKEKLNEEMECSFVPMPAVDEKGHINTSIVKKIKDTSKGFTPFKENDVLFAKITPCMENGKGGIALNLKNGVGFGSTEFHVLRPIENLSNPFWLYAITIFPKFRIDAKKIMTGTGGQLRVPINYLSDYMISCPPIDLQNEFANFVQQAEQSKQQLQKSLDSINAMTKALINENLK